ncbi:transglycosylase SLT domain-containing protein [Candidatus Woesearchaeota archaeon]|nr:transglycosylase SLT domain-containing protein [Candidatus Woesearchaeota archaeon]
MKLERPLNALGAMVILGASYLPDYVSQRTYQAPPSGTHHASSVHASVKPAAPSTRDSIDTLISSFSQPSYDIDSFLKDDVDREIASWNPWERKTYQRWLSQVTAYDDLIDEASVDMNYMRALVAWESHGGDHTTTSKKGAVGSCQFMPGTAKMWGLTVNDTIDERRNPVKAVPACTALVTHLAEKYKEGPSYLINAGYNWGEGSTDRMLKRHHGKSDEEKFAKLPSETKNHILKILAFKEIYDNPEKYGFTIEQHPSTKDYFAGLPRHTVATGDTGYGLSRKYDVPLKNLAAVNPEIVSLNRISKNWSLRIPYEN